MNNTPPPCLKQCKKERFSNLELLRIVAMLFIIAHHFVVNSTVLSDVERVGITQPNSIFLLLWGMWGKTAINSFILISGWFLCTSRLSWQKIFKLWFQIKFYALLFWWLFLMTDYIAFSFSDLKRICLGLLSGVNNGFSASFMAFYLFVPFYNRLIRCLNQKSHGFLIIALLFYFTLASTFLFARSMNEPFWYMTLYFLAAYLRLYPTKWSESKNVARGLLVSGFLLGLCSVCVLVCRTGDIWTSYHFVTDSNKLIALWVGLSAFLLAKNSQSFVSRRINWWAAGCFGVLLIHANSDAMRQWLWVDLLDVPGLYTLPLYQLIIISFITPVVIYAVAASVDFLYRKLVEVPVMRLIAKQEGKLQSIFGFYNQIS